MTPENFCYWLQGLFEVGKIDKLDEEQVKIIKDHLQLVFTKVTPGYTTSTDLPPNFKVEPEGPHNPTGNPVWINPFQTFCHTNPPNPKDTFICYSNIEGDLKEVLGKTACCSADKPVAPPNKYIKEDSNKPEEKQVSGFWNTKTNKFESFEKASDINYPKELAEYNKLHPEDPKLC